MSDAAQVRATRQLTRALGAKLAGRKGRPDTDPVHKHSYDVDSPQANRWTKVGEGSREQWRAHARALVRTCKELIVQHKQERYREADRLQANDQLVLEALLDYYNHRDGRLFPEHQTLADDTGLSRDTVIKALKRLRAHGFIDQVRRTMKVEEAEGEAGPQRKQTSNGYFFDWRRRMAKRVWQRFRQLVEAGLSRLGIVVGAPPNRMPPDPAAIAYSPLRATLAALAEQVDKAESASREKPLYPGIGG